MLRSFSLNQSITIVYSLADGTIPHALLDLMKTGVGSVRPGSMEVQTAAVLNVVPPYGHIIASGRWRNSTLLHKLKGAGVKVLFEDELGEDFHLPNKSCVLYVSECDVIAGNGYRRKLVRFRNACSSFQQLVLVDNTALTEQYFPAVQRFVVFDLGLVLLPVCGQTDASQLLAHILGFKLKTLWSRGCGVKDTAVDSQENWFQLILSAQGTWRLLLPNTVLVLSDQSQFKVHGDGRENPFRRRPPSGLLEPLVLALVQQFPGVGPVKAVALLQHFPSIQQLCSAGPAELEPLVGPAAAQQIHSFFHG